MSLSRHLWRGAAPSAVLFTLLLTAPATPAAAQGTGGAGLVFTATNDAQANAVLAFRRNADGMLIAHRVVPTGGAGSGGGLGNQGALAADASGRHLLVVNAGSDTISAFTVGPTIALADSAPSGGSTPISVTVHGDLVYVLNEGGGGNVSGLMISPTGQLTPLPGSTQPLSASGVDPAQIAFTPDGRFLIVTEKDTNSILVYPVGDDGLAGPPVVNASAGMTPFGFSFGQRSRLLVSEAAGGAAGLSTVSSYDVQPDGTLKIVTSALATTQSAACWLVTTDNGRYAYVTNTGSDTITGLDVPVDGAVNLLGASGVTATSGAAPIDAAATRNGRFLYVLNGDGDSIDAYAVDARGALTPIQTFAGLPRHVNGLVAL